MGTNKQNRWVDIQKTVLPAGARAPQVPEDTAKVPYTMRVSGFLKADCANAKLGDTVKIVTQIGREIEGTLIAENPSHSHSFGATVPELLDIGQEVFNSGKF